MAKASKHSFEISNSSKGSGLELDELWRYRDLILLFVKRDFTSFYKQTILGPFWFFIQPLFTSIVYMIVLTKGVGLNSSFLFFLVGVTFWAYFREVFSKISRTFTTNAGIFGKVYFPRMVYPISVALSAMIKLAVQLALFVVVFLIFYFQNPEETSLNSTVFYFPVCFAIIAFLAIGMGLILSSLTAKYKDFQHAIDFGLNLFMWLSFVMIPLTEFSNSNLDSLRHNAVIIQEAKQPNFEYVVPSQDTLSDEEIRREWSAALYPDDLTYDQILEQSNLLLTENAEIVSQIQKEQEKRAEKEQKNIQQLLPLNLFMYNPLVPPLETLKHGMSGAGLHNPWMLLYSGGFALLSMVLGMFMFKRTEKSFIDTV